MTLLLAIAHGAPPTDDALRGMLGKLAGTEVPASLFCVERPPLGAPFWGDVAAVGVQMKGVGCRLKAVAVKGALHDPASAMATSVGADAWAAMKPADREDTALRWTRDVLLAFDQPQTDGSATSTPAGGVDVDIPFLQRGKGPNVAHETPGSWAFGPDGAVTAASRTGGPAHRSELVMKFVGARGVEEAAVSEAITAHGRLFHDCVHDAWTADLAIEDRTRLAWDIGGGKASGMTAKGDTPPGLLQCYANALARTPFPPEMSGHIEWTFAIVRSPVTAE